MSGHSKWANIKRRKEGVDAKRGKIFTKIGREIAVAVKEGGSNPDANSKLKDVIAKAKANNMPNDTIARSISKAAGELGKINYEDVIYEGYGVSGVAVIVEVLTDNRNRTASDVRHIFDKCGGSLGATGCVSWMFEKKGIMLVEKDPSVDEESLMMTALDAGINDFDGDDDFYELTVSPEDFSKVRQTLEENGVSFYSAEVTLVPNNTISIDEESADKIQNMLDMFEDNDDVQNVYHNAEGLI
ncbi:MAG: YebC/PmpR family DNA-binding transcriptional regulator [Eubacteriales bacterium]